MATGGIWNFADVNATLMADEGERLRWAWLAHGEHSTVDAFYMAPGGSEEGFRHYHAAHDEILFIVNGTGTFILDGDEQPIGPGTVIFVPRGTHHEPKLPEGGSMLSVYAPAFDLAHPDRVFLDAHGNPRETQPA